MKDQVNKCQGLLFGVTENNGSVSAAMKNAYDWISRNGLIKGFPAGMVSVGGGASGLNGQKALKQIGEYFEIKFMSGHDIALNRFADPTLFDAEGNLLKAEVKEKLKGYNIALASWIHSHSHKKQAEKAPHA